MRGRISRTATIAASCPRCQLAERRRRIGHHHRRETSALRAGQDDRASRRWPETANATANPCGARHWSIHDDDETARFGMMATLLFLQRRSRESCDELCATLAHGSRFRSEPSLHRAMGSHPAGSVWPVAESQRGCMSSCRANECGRVTSGNRGGFRYCMSLLCTRAWSTQRLLAMSMSALHRCVLQPDTKPLKRGCL